MPISKAYQAARENAAYVKLNCVKSLEFSGKDRAKFLHGQVTCEVLSLGQGQSVHGCYVTPKGRLIAEFTLYNRGEILVLCCGESTFDALRDGLSRTIALAEAEMYEPPTPRGSLILTGPKAKELMARFTDVSRVDVVGVPWGAVPGGMLHGDSAVIDELTKELEGVAELTKADCEILRVERGVAKWGEDMSEDHFPLEVRLDEAVSFDKGCYMGQETLAHIKNLGHLNRRLVGLKIEGEIAAGAEVLAPGSSVGKLTSVVESPRLGTTLALAMMKDEAAAPGADLTVTGGHRATLVELPL